MTTERPEKGHEAAPPPKNPPPPGSVAEVFVEALRDVPLEVWQGAQDIFVQAPREHILQVLRVAHDDPRLQFHYLRSLHGVDQMEDGLEVVYVLYSWTKRHGVIIKTTCPADDARVPSAVSIWRGADWLERETAEMFGIVFEGHPNLVPLLLPEDMTDHHPLRKENPLAPIEEWQAELIAVGEGEGEGGGEA